MKQRYRIYVLGPIPSDLKERIAALHVAGILNGKKEGIPIHTQENNDNVGKAVNRATRKVLR